MIDWIKNIFRAEPTKKHVKRKSRTPKSLGLGTYNDRTDYSATYRTQENRDDSSSNLLAGILVAETIGLFDDDSHKSETTQDVPPSIPDTTVPSSDPGNSGFDSSPSYSDPGSSGFDTGSSGYDSGSSGFDSGSSGFDSGSSGF
jgi:hypothetical protein